jgi:hypothetical protein
MIQNKKSLEIISIKTEIDNLKEYLASDLCKSCGDAAIKLEEYIDKLIIILNTDDTNS